MPAAALPAATTAQALPLAQHECWQALECPSIQLVCAPGSPWLRTWRQCCAAPRAHGSARLPCSTQPGRPGSRHGSSHGTHVWVVEDGRVLGWVCRCSAARHCSRVLCGGCLERLQEAAAAPLQAAANDCISAGKLDLLVVSSVMAAPNIVGRWALSPADGQISVSV